MKYTSFSHIYFFVRHLQGAEFFLSNGNLKLVNKILIIRTDQIQYCGTSSNWQLFSLHNFAKDRAPQVAASRQHRQH